MSPIINAPYAGGFLEIDLTAVQQNYQRLQNHLGPVPCACVVKADAYGLGVAEVAPALYQAGARVFFVAFVDEAIPLRSLLPHDAEIHVLGGLYPDSEQAYLDHNLVPILNSLEQIQRWQNRGPFDLQVDTGMTRLGIAQDDWAQLPNDLTPDILLSHFVCGDDHDHPVTRQQIDFFQQAVDSIPHKRASLANSAGIFIGPETHHDLGRPGCALYGINPTPNQPNPMATVAHLYGKIAQIHNVDSQATVGYGATFALEKGQKIATVGVGYADGYLRSLSSQGIAAVNGQLCPVVGRVSMDAIAVDVSGLDVQEGDWIELMGNSVSVDLLADKAGTIGYELLTSLGSRYMRTYRR